MREFVYFLYSTKRQSMGFTIFAILEDYKFVINLQLLLTFNFCMSNELSSSRLFLMSSRKSSASKSIVGASKINIHYFHG